jgi:hypothetical protein
LLTVDASKTQPRTPRGGRMGYIVHLRTPKKDEHR